MSFLNAEWRKLVMANYVVDPKILTPYIPDGTTLDFYEGRCYVSLVGFMFLNTRLMGVSIPFHRDFEEVNLRFYVKFQDGDVIKRGVVFIKEIVPKSAITFVANTVYHERYETHRMNHSWHEKDETLTVKYQWQKRNRANSIWVRVLNSTSPLIQGTEEAFITEHYWGYSKLGNKTFEYEVKHPTWTVYQVKDFGIDLDFEELYGPEFQILNDMKPQSVLLAEGSEISVESKRPIQ